MDIAVNYVSTFNVEELKCFNNILIKFPGARGCKLSSLKKLVSIQKNLVLHGIIPSSGSILDSELCDNISEFAKIYKNLDQRWISIHLEGNPKYKDCGLDNLKNNVNTLKKIFGDDITILVENSHPYACLIEKYTDPMVISQICTEYDLGFLLDIPHAIVSASYRNEDIMEYIDNLPLQLVKEIHISGVTKKEDGSFLDSHLECDTQVYELLKYVLLKGVPVELISIEYSPIFERRSGHIFNMQMLQINKVKRIIKEVESMRGISN